MTDNAAYLETLLDYYEEEVMGEAYFYGLADHIGGAVEREKLALLAEVERRAADVVRPLLEKHGLVPRDESVLKALGEADVERHRHYGWMELMVYMAGRYPAYLDDFEALERLAPEDDMPALKLLTAVSEQIGLRRAGEFRNLQRCRIPSGISTARPR